MFAAHLFPLNQQFLNEYGILQASGLRTNSSAGLLLEFTETKEQLLLYSYPPTISY